MRQIDQEFFLEWKNCYITVGHLIMLWYYQEEDTEAN